MIKLFLLGVQPSTWKIIDELHQDTKTSVKWKQQTSEIFSSHQGVKQGGLLSAELYKLCIEDLLKIYENSKQERVIIEINNTKRNHRYRQPPIKINQNYICGFFLYYLFQ